MKEVQVGDWVAGPYLNATSIEGFVLQVLPNTYKIIIDKIDSPINDTPHWFHRGSIHEIDKRIVHMFFMSMNQGDHEELIALALKLNQEKWAEELKDRLGSVHRDAKHIAAHSTIIFSKLMGRYIRFTDEVKSKLYSFYSACVPAGMQRRIEKPEDIMTGEDLDSVVMLASLRNYSDELLEFLRGIALSKEDMNLCKYKPHS